MPPLFFCRPDVSVLRSCCHMRELNNVRTLSEAGDACFLLLITNEGKHRMRRINIAIDGPAGAGKSTVARMTADRLGFNYVDTGAMYRAVTWAVLQERVSLDDVQAIVQIAKQISITLETNGAGTAVYVNGQNVTEVIRSQEVTANVSAVAGIADVRKILVYKQRQMAQSGGVVMDGRDIGTKVLQNAALKIFLTASIEERAKRRFAEMREKGIEVTLDTLEQEIAIRDKRDRERVESPLVKAKDAIEIDTTKLSLNDVVAKILRLARTHMCCLE